MLARLGFVASVLAGGSFDEPHMPVRNASEERPRRLIAENLAALDRVLSFLERHRIHLYRINSNLIPFASHRINTIRWGDEYADTFSRLGATMRRVGIRVSTHPGQFTVLNSPHRPIVRAAVAELVYHARLLDALDADTSCKIVVHVGGLYGETERIAMDRFITTARALPREVHRRLVVENDDRLFDAEEVMGREVGIPVVFDWLHHRANGCRRPIYDVLPEIYATWTEADGPPKVHLSSQARNGPAGAHADYVDPNDAIEFLQSRRPRCSTACSKRSRKIARSCVFAISSGHAASSRPNSRPI